VQEPIKCAANSVVLELVFFTAGMTPIGATQVIDVAKNQIVGRPVLIETRLARITNYFTA
jgi:hypothetical protein